MTYTTSKHARAALANLTPGARSRGAVPVAEPTYSRCKCGALDSTENRRDYGCRICGKHERKRP
jgi:hypothetical protein